jgi:hypothetical protein
MDTETRHMFVSQVLFPSIFLLEQISPSLCSNTEPFPFAPSYILSLLMNWS